MGGMDFMDEMRGVDSSSVWRHLICCAALLLFPYVLSRVAFFDGQITAGHNEHTVKSTDVSGLTDYMPRTPISRTRVTTDEHKSEQGNNNNSKFLHFYSPTEFLLHLHLRRNEAFVSKKAGISMPAIYLDFLLHPFAHHLTQFVYILRDQDQQHNQ